MRYFATRAPLLAVLSLFAVQAGPVPRPSPELTVDLVGPGATGKLNLSSFKGKRTVLLWFFSPTCPHCQKFTKVASEVQREYAARGVQVIGVAFDSESKLVPDFIRDYKVNYPMGYTTRDAIYAYVQHSMMLRFLVPRVIMIDTSGVIQVEHSGEEVFFQGDEAKNVRAALDKVLKGGSVAKK